MSRDMIRLVKSDTLHETLRARVYREKGPFGISMAFSVIVHGA